MGRLGNGLMTHLVAIGFLLFAVIAVIFREPLFGAKQQPKKPTGGERAVAEARIGLSEKKGPEKKETARSRPSVVFRPVRRDEVVSPGGTGPRTISPPRQDRSRPGEVVQKQSSPQRSVAPARERLPPDQLLLQARQAFWKGRSSDAETLYRRYLQLRPGDPKGFGELGNLYQSMGRQKEALDAYYQAGLRLRHQGSREQLERIIDILGKAGDPRARDLAGK